MPIGYFAMGDLCKKIVKVKSIKKIYLIFIYNQYKDFYTINQLKLILDISFK